MRSIQVYLAPLGVKRDAKALIDRREFGRIKEVAALERWIVGGIRKQGAQVLDLADGKQGLKHRTAVIGIERLEDEARGFGIHENQPIRADGVFARLYWPAGTRESRSRLIPGDG